MKSNCPSTGGDDNLAPLDVTSPTSFDNAHFKNLMSKKGLLHSDQQLFNGGSTDFQVGAYSSDLGSFQIDFANAMVKMGALAHSQAQAAKSGKISGKSTNLRH